MNVLKLVTSTDLDNKTIHSNEQNKLEVTPVKRYKRSDIEFFVCERVAAKETIANDNDIQYNDGNRRMLQVLGGFGKVHLDFVPKVNTGKVVAFKLPANAPIPLELIETQTHDGGTVWIEPKAREIWVQQLKANTRYIIDLVGFFGDP